MRGRVERGLDRRDRLLGRRVAGSESADRGEGGEPGSQ